MLEQGVALLRTARTSDWNNYLGGATPLLVAVVYAIARVSVHRMTADEIGFGAAILTVLFLWMSWMKMRFAGSLYARLAELQDDPTDISSAVFLQGTKLIMTPLSLLAGFPFAWMVAFYRNLAVFAKRPNGIRESARMARLWQRQSWSALGVVAVFALVVFVNVVILLGLLPSLVRVFSGYENDVTRDPAAMFNATFVATAVAVTWLVIDPLLQAIFVVRCFKGESVGSGADLRTALRRVVVGLALAFASVSAAHARPVSSVELDAQIRHTLKAPEYSWQNPEAAGDDAPRWAQEIIKAGKAIQHALSLARDWVVATLRELFRSQDAHVERGPGVPGSGLRWAIYTALVLIAILAVLILRKAFGAPKASRIPSPAAAALVDLSGDVVASELPEEEWLRLAREALDRGDFRQALRAAYLANLAWLGGAGFVSISRFKSNRDYEREVRLRSRSDEITSLLKSNREVFESAWYGDEERTRGDVEAMQRNLIRMRELAHA